MSDPNATGSRAAGPSLYATLALIIQTTHAERAVDAMKEAGWIPLVHLEQIEGIVIEATRRAYVDGLRDGFVQGVEREAARHE